MIDFSVVQLFFFEVMALVGQSFLVRIDGDLRVLTVKKATHTRVILEDAKKGKRYHARSKADGILMKGGVIIRPDDPLVSPSLLEKKPSYKVYTRRHMDRNEIFVIYEVDAVEIARIFKMSRFKAVIIDASTRDIKRHVGWSQTVNPLLGQYEEIVACRQLLV